jgi:hypothetical protein
LPPKADIRYVARHVRDVPTTDIGRIRSIKADRIRPFHQLDDANNLLSGLNVADAGLAALTIAK